MAKKRRTKAKKSNNKLLFIIGGAVLAVAAVALAIYSVASPGPEERVARGLVKLLDANVVSIESMSTVETEQATTTTTLKAVTDKKVVDASYSSKIEAEGQDAAEVNAEVVIVESGDMYAKIDNPRQSLSTMMDAMISSQLTQNNSAGAQQEEVLKGVRTLMKSYVDTAADKIGDKWVRVPKQDLSLVNQGSSVSMGCYIDFVRTVKSDADARKQLVEQFEDNNFLKIEEKLDSKGTSAGYRVSVDQEVLDAFIEQAKDNAAFSTILECDPTLSLLVNAAEDGMAIWVDRISHSITHMEFSAPADTAGEPQESTTEVVFGYSGRVQATKPDESIDMSELMVDGVEQGESATVEEATPVAE